jgi:glycosyltransferase involved in cell wall biosynthesis
LEADLLDYAAARHTTGLVGKLLEKLDGADLMLAWACFKRRRRYKVIFTDGEQVGIPLALLLKLARSRRTRHVMIAHVLSVRKKELFFDLLGIQRYVDMFLVYSSWQKRFIEQRWKVPAERVVFTPFMVDSRFFSPTQVTPDPKPQICAVGLEFRDYPTLIEAVKDLDLQVVIAAASPWSKRADSTAGREIPSNVHVRRFSQYELRQVYADSRFLVMPLYDVNFQAGVTAILEAMAMERAVICSRTAGQTDVLVEQQTGLYVPPGDPDALRAAIERLWSDPAEAQRMGYAGRERVEREMNLDHYVARLSEIVSAQLRAIGRP